MIPHIVFTDIHFGHKGNSTQYNQDCLDFIDFFIETAAKRQIKHCLFLGDYFHVRNNISVLTLNYAIQGIRKLAAYFDQVTFIIGNHDLYYRDTLDVHSLEFLKEFPNIRLIDKITQDGDATFVPWLVGENWKKVKSINTPYVFGHFELPGFLLNSNTMMPDRGEINTSVFGNNIKYVLSGHFHKRQIKKIGAKEFHYIGSALSQTFSDSNDYDHGLCVIENGQPEYINWKNSPNYVNMFLSTILEQPEKYINSKTYAKVKVDLPVSHDDALFIRETYMGIFQARELALIQESNSEDANNDDISFVSVDQLVTDSLKKIESKTINPDVLTKLYLDL